MVLLKRWFVYVAVGSDAVVVFCTHSLNAQYTLPKNAAPTTWGEDGTTKTSSPISFKQPTSSRDDAVTKEQRNQRHDMNPVNNLECYKCVELSDLG